MEQEKDIREYIDLDQAACNGKDTEMFFPKNKVAEYKAKAVCSSCPVVLQCLMWAITEKEVGIWGGATTKERKELRSPRSRAIFIKDLKSGKRFQD